MVPELHLKGVILTYEASWHVLGDEKGKKFNSAPLERCCGTEEFGCSDAANKTGCCQMQTASLWDENPRKVNEGVGQF